MATKPTNLRFLLSLGGTKMVVLQDEEDLRVYTNRTTAKPRNKKETIAPEHVTEAILAK